MKTDSALGKPLSVICAAVYICSVLTAELSVGVKLSAAFCAAALSAIIIILRRVGRLSNESAFTVLCVLLPISLSLAVSAVSLSLPIRRAESLDGEQVSVTAEITAVGHRSEHYGYYTARLHSERWRGAVTASLAMPDGGGEIGDVICGEVTFALPESGGSYDEAAILRADGIYITAESESMEYSGHRDAFSLTGAATAVNRVLTARISDATDGSSTIAPAVLLGRRDLLSPSVKRDFSRLGISHLFALSGLHLSIIVAGAELMLNRTRLGVGVRCTLMSVGVLAFMVVTGFSPSVVRAGIMTLIRLAAAPIGRQSDSLTSLSFAAAVMVTAKSCLAFDTGLLLSVLATYGCIVYAERSAERAKRRGVRRGLFWRVVFRVCDVVALTLIITALTLPVMWHVFGEVSLVSPVSNLIFVPLITVIIYLSLPLLLVCHVPMLAVPLAHLLLALESSVVQTASAISHIPHIMLPLKFPGVGLLSALIFITVGTALTLKCRERLAKLMRVGICVSCAGLCCVVAASFIISASTADVTFRSRGKNEGFVLRCGMSTVAVDISDGSAGFAGEILFLARRDGASELDAVVLTHYHMKHLSGISSLTERAIVKKLVLPEPESDADLSVCESLLRLCGERGIGCEFYSRRRGETFEIGGVKLSFFDRAVTERSDHPVVTFEAAVGGKRTVYAGGSASEGDVSIFDALFRSDVAVFGSHPPAYKVPLNAAAGGSAVFTKTAADSGYLTDVTVGGAAYRLEGDDVYNTGRYRKSRS